MRPIPDPILTPFSGRNKPALQPLVQVQLPRPSSPPAASEKSESKPAGNRSETKTQEAPKKQEKPEQTGKPAGNEAPKIEEKKQEIPTPVLQKKVLGVAEDGTQIPAPFQPVDALTALASSNPTLALVMIRQLRDMSGPMPDTSNGALSVIEKLENGLKSGQDISTLGTDISMHLMGDDEHNELLLRLSNALDRERMTEIFKSRAKFEDFCHACMRRGDLSVIEGASIMGYWNTQLGSIYDRIQKKLSKGDAVLRESGDLVQRVNRPTLLQNRQIQVKFDEAAPQEREILRKLAFKLETALTAKVTTTTTTTETKTVEIVQQPQKEAVDI